MNISTQRKRKKEILLLSLLNCNIIFMIIIIIRITPVFVMLIKLKQSTSAFRFTKRTQVITARVSLSERKPPAGEDLKE